MPKLTYVEAAHRLRMSVKLLKWFTTYAVLGRKLQVDDEGRFDEVELDDFDELLRGPWPTRAVPAGISDELRREARGRCTICDETAPLEEMHIARKGKERNHYNQHPHNLTLACPNCHSRYDRADKTLTRDVVATWKEQARQRHLRQVDADIAMREALSAALAPFIAQLQQEGAQFWSQPAGLTAIEKMTEIVEAEVGPMSARPGIEPLEFLSTSLAGQYPVTSAQLDSLEEGGTEEGAVWDHLDADESHPWMCLYGDEIALVETAVCPACGEECYDHYNEMPRWAEFAEDGATVIAHFEDARGDDVIPECPKCGHSPLDFEFQTLCSYHRHVADKAAYD